VIVRRGAEPRAVASGIKINFEIRIAPSCTLATVAPLTRSLPFAVLYRSPLTRAFDFDGACFPGAEALGYYQMDWALTFRSEISQVFDRLAETPLIYQIAHRDIRRAVVHRFPYLIWYRVAANTVIVLACTYAGRDPKRVKARLK